MLERSKVFIGVGIWFIVALVLGLTGTFMVTSPQNPPLALGLGVVLPIIFFILLFRFSSAFNRVVQSLDLSVLTMLHLWRFLGIDFLIQYNLGRLPAGFAYPAAIGDIAIAVTAIPMAMAFRRDPQTARPWFIAWNIFGLIDLVIAVGLGILHSGSSFGFLTGTGPTADIMAMFPRSMVPTFFVPLFISIHLLALIRSQNQTSHHLAGQGGSHD